MWPPALLEVSARRLWVSRGQAEGRIQAVERSLHALHEQQATAALVRGSNHTRAADDPKFDVEIFPAMSSNLTDEKADIESEIRSIQNNIAKFIANVFRGMVRLMN